MELADRKPLSPREAEAKHLLKHGKGNAYVEFDALPEDVQHQANRRTAEVEFFMYGDVDLLDRNPQGFNNR